MTDKPTIDQDKAREMLGQIHSGAIRLMAMKPEPPMTPEEAAYLSYRAYMKAIELLNESWTTAYPDADG